MGDNGELSLIQTAITDAWAGALAAIDLEQIIQTAVYDAVTDHLSHNPLRVVR